MELFLRSTALLLVGLLLSLIVNKRSADLGLLLVLAISCTVCLACAEYLSAMMDFLSEVRLLGGLDRNLFSVLLKCAGIGFLSEVCCLICQDSGQNTLAKVLQILANCTVVYLSLPMLRQLLQILEEVIGSI